MNHREVMQQALEALESGDWYINQLEQIVYSSDDTGTHEERAKVQAAITVIRAALAEFDANPQNAGQPQTDSKQEPVAWRYRPGPSWPWSLTDDGYFASCKRDSGYTVEPLYAHPSPKRQPLTDEEIVDIWADVSMGYDDEINIIELARAIEKAHGIGGKE